MQDIRNTLYVQTDGAILRLDHDTVLVTKDKETLHQVPLIHVESIVGIGRVTFTSPLLERCSQTGRTVVKMTGQGRFVYRLEGPKSGNVLLRMAQFQAAVDPVRATPVVQAIVAGKLYNSRQNLLRSARDSRRSESQNLLREAAEDIGRDLRRLDQICDISALRGVEGINAKRYFSVFRHQFSDMDDEFTRFEHRSRRPPRDPMNCLLSFLYALLTNDALSAAESVGLDPQVGFLHVLRPGRPSLALDLMEELRPMLADRIAITLVNRRQIGRHHFEWLPGGAVSLTEQGRKVLIAAYQVRKKDEVIHPLLQKKVPIAQLLPIQARLLARAIRRDHVKYVPLFHKA
ncbi:type I-C CRISPR-associated endonuclease Cas1 [Alicyclobacillus cycloheptanicus]|uniref:CRISPR-associated endonuclease Cas1 n=1 Tax=Alicyclobacillus cycloheptanicus TaxID=1457 RepID=A0ABT9XH63_9BACL|nr:type I-C CRISPR-associated endonuclease Cas1c [Alicyclobacillus cycloheptanicus]MDQ0189642.1 CRISPR-associated protein Cas1 [Alicyclobacillus cycloheptanicus]WDL99945.1 type I-C CRISPR-associated endonuclease Cas1 [Alicyclobacillus cycloheptanicus]